MALHLELLMELSWVLQMALLMVPMMANLWVDCLLVHLDKMIGLSLTLHMVILMAWLLDLSWVLLVPSLMFQ